MKFLGILIHPTQALRCSYSMDVQGRERVISVSKRVIDKFLNFEAHIAHVSESKNPQSVVLFTRLLAFDFYEPHLERCKPGNT